jgi:branched-chain amino acid transport system ATP-binding protein
MSKPLLTIQNLYKSFGAIHATNNVTFSIEKGDIHALIGPNGAGKTTLVNQLSGDILPDRGTVHFQSTDITKLTAYKRAQLGIARSFQITHIFEQLTVSENMALAIHSKNGHNFKFWRRALGTPKVIEELSIALERVDLAGRSGQPARFLSHGEKRQLEVGMSLVGNPKLLIMDEPMAGMGSGGTRELTKLIEGLRGEVTILLVEHDMDVVFSLADRVTVLVYGEHAATGTPDEIRGDSQVRSAYLGEEQ